MQEWSHPVLVGEGAFSKVYRVTNKVTGELAVCKISGQRELAEKEAKLLGQILHPLFPAYKGQCLVQDKHCLLMEYICGSTLQQYVEKRGALSWERALEILLELAKGLQYLHEQPEPIVFRDVKPRNVMIQQDGRVRLVDLGCACMLGKQDGSRAGTRGFAAPEQLREGAELGRECDVYALGKLLGYMLKEQKHIPRSLLQLLEWTTREEPVCRLPDMRTFIFQLEYHTERKKIPQRLPLFCGRRTLEKNTATEFYYKKNIHKET